MLRSRKSVVVLLLVVVACAAILPLASGDVSAVLVPLYVIVPTASASAVRFDALRRDEQPLALLSLLASRAPPAAFVLA